MPLARSYYEEEEILMRTYQAGAPAYGAKEYEAPITCGHLHTTREAAQKCADEHNELSIPFAPEEVVYSFEAGFWGEE